MSTQMRYHHGMIADHVGAQRALKASLDQDLTETLQVLADCRGFWEGHGSDNYEVFHRQVTQLFQGVFGDIDNHSVQQAAASAAALAADHASAASLVM